MIVSPKYKFQVLLDQKGLGGRTYILSTQGNTVHELFDNAEIVEREKSGKEWPAMSLNDVTESVLIAVAKAIIEQVGDK
jgi:Mor family transcriptional regulator